MRHIVGQDVGKRDGMIDIEIGRTPTGGRHFPIAFRLEFIHRWDAATDRGAKTRLLREHNLTTATVRRWLHSRDEGEFTGLTSVTREERSLRRMENADRAELTRLRKENAALKHKVAQGEAVQEILGKAYELLEGITTSSTTDDEPEIPPALLSATEYANWLERNKLH
ncbi:hypothetical protein [Rhodococcus opacus]|uniref:hypothetical protein n=1 Tax=Rhodococcus opacus TaxID=37919 RepID=UPI001F548483|nr:hypothetical protein [Rhodococcus opacus]